MTVEQRHKDLAKRFWRVHPSEIQEMGISREEFYAHEIARFEASLTQQPSPDVSVEGLAGVVTRLQTWVDSQHDHRGYGEAGPPIYFDDVRAILAALTTREAVVEECAAYLDGYAGGHYMAQSCAAAIRALAAKEVV